MLVEAVVLVRQLYGDGHFLVWIKAPPWALLIIAQVAWNDSD